MSHFATKREEFDANGYVIAPGLFSPDDVAFYRDYFTAMRDRGGDGWAEGGVHFDSEDPLKT